VVMVRTECQVAVRWLSADGANPTLPLKERRVVIQRKAIELRPEAPAAAFDRTGPALTVARSWIHVGVVG